ncbi:hypothetical protein [Tolypothrix sp. PCC 7910]|nr:hypothetical protein [Tolypothrix sp. PCC 7910]
MGNGKKNTVYQLPITNYRLPTIKPLAGFDIIIPLLNLQQIRH